MRILCALLAAYLLFHYPTARAQDFPVRPVRLIVPIAPGGTNDILARALAQKLSESWKQSVVVDNRPGGGGITGTELAARSAADGHTLLVVNISHAVNPSLHSRLPYNILTDFAPITLIGQTPNVLVAHPSIPAATLAELISLSKASPGKLNYASAGNASSPHLAAELFKLKSGIDIVHVPYQGTGPALTALLGNEVALTFSTVPPALALVSAGRLRALAITSSQRSGALPKVPTFSEAGLADYEFTAWFGLVAPAATPPALIHRIAADARSVLGAAEFRNKYSGQGVDVAATTPEQFSRHMRQEIAKWKQVLAAAGIKSL